MDIVQTIILFLIGGGSGAGLLVRWFNHKMRQQAKAVDAKLETERRQLDAQIEGDRQERKQFQSMLNIYQETSLNYAKATENLATEVKHMNELRLKELTARSRESEQLNTTLLHLSDIISKIDAALATNTTAVDGLRRDVTTMSEKLETVSDKHQEITALQTERDSLLAQNADLEDAAEKMTKRLNIQDTERKRLITARQKLDQQLIEMKRKLADCAEKEQAETEPSDDSQEDAAA